MRFQANQCSDARSRSNKQAFYKTVIARIERSLFAITTFFIQFNVNYNLYFRLLLSNVYTILSLEKKFEQVREKVDLNIGYEKKEENSIARTVSSRKIVYIIRNIYL